MKLNMGCGFNKLPGFVNIDKFSECSPDLQIDLEKFPYPIESNQADEIMFNHCLEHLGQATEIFLEIIKEIYRIAKPNAKLMINVPHPRHDHFLGDPTHVRVINPQVLSLFSKKNNLHWKEVNASNSPLALYLNVDFEVVENTHVLDPYYQAMFDRKEVTVDQLIQYAQERNNVFQEIKFVLKVIK
jgi:hypothetical protein